MNLSFEHSYIGEPSVPILVRSPLTGREVVVDALIDTGSNVTMLEAWVASRLDIEVDTVAHTSVVGVGGVVPDVALAEVEITILAEDQLSAKVLAAFLPANVPPIGNLIGTDVLAFFDLGLSHANQTLYFGVSG